MTFNDRSTSQPLAFSFLSLGDWGGASLGEQYASNVYNVAQQLALSASALDANFIINTGDNYYWCGIQNASDFQVAVDWLDPFNDSSLQIPWYSVLGNHEYGYNVQAQIDLANVYPNWIMDDRYYTRRIELDGSTNTYLSFIFLDTSPCVADYRGNNPDYWDPCMTKYPTCSISNTNDDFEGPCLFHQNILSQSCDDQYLWLQSELKAIPEDDWLIIVGHHPIDEVDVTDFTALIQERGFSLYFNGHAHTLAQYTIDYNGVYITSGAGALVNTTDQDSGKTVAKLAGKDFRFTKFLKGENLGASHSYQTVYNNKVAGFTQHTFSDDYSYLTTDFVTYQGTIVHSFTSNKAGTIL